MSALNIHECRAAIIGTGQTARGAMRVLFGLGATIEAFNIRQEKLFKKRMGEFDLIVNCVLWNTSRKDRLIYREDLKKLKPGAMIIDISCDPNLEIETSRPTTIDDPVYVADGILHYAVDNTPAMHPLTVTGSLSEGIRPYIDIVMEKEVPDYPENLVPAVQILNGHILDERITEFRTRAGLFCK